MLFFFFFNPFLSLLLSVAPPNGKDPPSAFPSLSFSPFCPSVLLLCVLSLSAPLSPCTLWYADMQEFRPQNDRPNLSVLAPVTKDGRPSSVHACHWWTPELRSTWLVFSCSSHRFFFLFFFIIFSWGRGVNISFCLRQQLRDRVSSSGPLLHHRWMLLLSKSYIKYAWMRNVSVAAIL